MGPTVRELVKEEERLGGVGRTLVDGIEYDGHPGGARRTFPSRFHTSTEGTWLNDLLLTSVYPLHPSVRLIALCFWSGMEAEFGPRARSSFWSSSSSSLSSPFVCGAFSIVGEGKSRFSEEK